MKNTIIVLIVLLLSIPAFAQDNVAYPKLDNYLKAEKNEHGLLLQANNKKWNYKRFIELFNSLLHPAKRSTGRPVTFMDGPVLYSAVPPVEINRDISTVYARYSAVSTEPSSALQLLGIAAGITAGALSKGRYTGVYNPYPYYGNSKYSDGSFRYLDSRAAIEASYLQSTFRQH
jgi:hypothetical protein